MDSKYNWKEKEKKKWEGGQQADDYNNNVPLI